MAISKAKQTRVTKRTEPSSQLEFFGEGKRRIVKALLLSNLISVALFGLRVIATHNDRYWFLFWNLMLAWFPAMFAFLLVRQLHHKSWNKPVPLILTLLWLVFLPNSFYLISDLIHLQNTGDIGILFDAVLFLSCIWNGIIAGMLSIVWIHKAAYKRVGSTKAAIAVAVTFLLVSIAIYLGRVLRWNTWDVLFSPAGILFDVSERVISPLTHPRFMLTTSSFFILLGSMYVVIWQFVRCYTPLTNNKN